MRLVVQVLLRGVYEPVWSSSLIRRDDTVRDTKILEVQNLAYVLGQVTPHKIYQIGVHDHDSHSVAMNVVHGSDLLDEVRRIITYATQGCATQK